MPEKRLERTRQAYESELSLALAVQRMHQAILRMESVYFACRVKALEQGTVQIRLPRSWRS